MPLDNYNKFFVYYSNALRIRMIEDAVAQEYPKGEMRCPVHLSIGQELNAVAIAECMEKDDFMVSTHRGHAHYLAKGGSLDGFLGELYGKSTGCSRGNGGSMHLVDRSCGFLASTSIVGGTIPIGVGAAFAAKLQGKNKLTAVCIGDAAIEEGVFHEAANFASLHKLPVIFFMENNLYSCFTPLEKRQPHRDDGFRAVAEAHGMPFVRIRWDRFFDGVATLQAQIKVMRLVENFGPIFVECDAYRFVQHCGPDKDDNLNYRPPSEIMRHESLDPLKTLKEQLIVANFLTPSMEQNLETKISVELSMAFDKVKNAKNPTPLELGRYLYA